MAAKVQAGEPKPVFDPRGVRAGLGFRREIAAELLSQPQSVDLIEVVAESCFSSKRTWREAEALAELWPLVIHGVKLSLGSAEGIDLDRARALGRLARAVRAPAITEHVAFVRAGGVEIGHLTALPRTREAVRVVAKNVARVRRVLPDIPLLLENVAWTFQWPTSELDEPEFYSEICQLTGCSLLLDLGNLLANALNSQQDPYEVLSRFPLDHVSMIHLAGGEEEDGFYFDDHAHALPDVELGLLAWLVERVGPRPAIIERDDHFPPFADLIGEVNRVRSVLSESSRSSASIPQSTQHSEDLSISRAQPDVSEPSHGKFTSLLAQQAAAARVLASEARAGAAPLDAVEVGRTRGILERKRVDEALPLLPSLSADPARAKIVAAQALEGTVRAANLGGVLDALRVARAACEDDKLKSAAARDLLLLRARFSHNYNTGAIRRRVTPYVGRSVVGGRHVWAIKGPGADATVHLWDPWVR